MTSIRWNFRLKKTCKSDQNWNITENPIWLASFSFRLFSHVTAELHFVPPSVALSLEELAVHPWFTPAFQTWLYSLIIKQFFTLVLFLFHSLTPILQRSVTRYWQRYNSQELLSVWNQVEPVWVTALPVTKYLWNGADRCVGRYCDCRHQEPSVAGCVLMEWPACVLLGTGWGQGSGSGVRRWGVCVIGEGLDRVSGWRHRVVWGLEGIQRCLCNTALPALDARASASQLTDTERASYA